MGLLWRGVRGGSCPASAAGPPVQRRQVGGAVRPCVACGGVLAWAGCGLFADRGRLLVAPAASGGVLIVVIYIVGFRAVRGLFGVLLRVCSTGWLRIVANIRLGGGYVTQRVTVGKPSDHPETLKTLLSLNPSIIIHKNHKPEPIY